jgi:uncharacterized protein (DUF1919 family)
LLKNIRNKLWYYRKYIVYKRNKFRERNYLRRIRKENKNIDFSIISNNCWGGSISEDLQLPYNSPTVGLFFFAPCYLKFILDLEEKVHDNIEFIKESKYEKGNYLQSLKPYPIGLLKGEIEIHFLHYENELDALEKWRRRTERINYQNLFLSFSDSETCNDDQIRTFDSLSYKKVFFSSKEIPGIKSLVFLKSYMGLDGIGNIYDDRWSYRKYFDVVKWLNNR